MIDRTELDRLWQEIQDTSWCRPDAPHVRFAAALAAELAGYQMGAKAEADAGDEARAVVRRLEAENAELRLQCGGMDLEIAELRDLLARPPQGLPVLSEERSKEISDKTRANYLAYADELWGGDPNCQHDVQCAPGGGVKCTKCGAWCCY